MYFHISAKENIVFWSSIMKNKGLILALSLILIIFNSLAQIKHNKAGLQLYYSFEELPKDKSGKKHKGKIHGKINLKSEI